MTLDYRKTSGSHPAAAEVEAAGLRWLASAEAAGGPSVVDVLEVGPGLLRLERVAAGRATASAAEDFGTALALMHTCLWPQENHDDAGSALLFGQLPPDHPTGVPPLFGPAEQLLELGAGQHRSWGAFHAAERLGPVLRRLRAGAASDWQRLDSARDRIAAGEFDGIEPPSLIHGDLWSGNVLWPENGAVLIDPAAHTGHRESDLALLQLFGLPYLEQMLTSYQRTAPLSEGWQARVPVHRACQEICVWDFLRGRD